MCHQSHQITTCYETYRKSLGETVKNFEAAIKEETEYLLMIDDIINEIGMIKRVHQDQDKIGIAIAGSDAINPHAPQPPGSVPTLLTKPNRSPSERGRSSSPVKFLSPDAVTSTSSLVTLSADNHNHDILSHNDADAPDFYVREENPLRSAESRRMITKLDRLEEDARRVRKSVSPSGFACFC